MTLSQLKPNQFQRGLVFPDPAGAGNRRSRVSELVSHGVEETDETGRLWHMVPVRTNLAVHGLEDDIRQSGKVGSYYHNSTDRVDFVLTTATCAGAKSTLAKPNRRSVCEAESHLLFNVNAVETAMRVSARLHPERKPQYLPKRQDHERLRDSAGQDCRFPFGLPLLPWEIENQRLTTENSIQM